MRIAILASGNGTNAQAIIDRVRAGILSVEIACVISNHAHARVLARAREAGLDARIFERSAFNSRQELDAAIVACLKEYGCDLVVLAGYMLIIGPQFINAYQNRILNIHPSLLPAFAGTSGIADAYNYGVRLTGVSVHFVAQEVDAGPLIIQAAIPVRQNEAIEELESRIHAVEHRIYPQAIQWLAEGRLKIQGRHVMLAPCTRKPARQDADCLVWPPLEEGF